MTTAPFQPGPVEPLHTRRKIILHDVVTFLTLTCITAVLFGVTWLLFRSFTARREAQAREWAALARTALARHEPEKAIVDLRAALSFAPDDREDELLLAEALADAGHTEEATNYFLGLWETRPGDGFINLQLARLNRRSKHPQRAIDDYRAAIFGNWQGQAVEHRRAIRLELADFLVERHDPASARAELLIAGSNADGDPAVAVTIGDALLHADDPTDALTYYRKSLALRPHDRSTLERAGRLAYAEADYPTARTLLVLAQHEKPEGPSQGPELSTLIADATRLIALDLSRELPAHIRAQHLLEASTIARHRLDACLAQLAPSGPIARELLDLATRWTPLESRTGRAGMLHDPDIQDDAARLIADTETETETASRCGQPTGDDALLLQLVTTGNEKEIQPHGR